MAIQEGVKHLVQTFLEPSLKKLYKKGESVEFFSGQSTYLESTYAEFHAFKPLVFHHTKPFHTIYIPLTITSEEEKEYKLIKSHTSSFFKENDRVIVTDAAGMGKSTLSKFLFMECIENKYGVPVFVELRKVPKNTKLVDYVFSLLCDIGEDINVEEKYRSLKNGDFIFFFDGYDEISEVNKKSVSANLIEFIKKAPNNKFIVTSRPEEGLGIFSRFTYYKIEGLSKDEAYELILKYGENKPEANALVEALKKPNEVERVEDFLTNPLLVSLLFRSFEYGKHIPVNKNYFYRLVYEALFKQHDLSKGELFEREKVCGLDMEKFHLVMRHLAYNSLKQDKLSFTKDQLNKLLANICSDVEGVSFETSKFITDLELNVPMLILDGLEYKWAHKSLREYFAACYIFYDADEKQDLILNQMYLSERCHSYYNVFDIYSDLNPTRFRNKIIKDFLTELVNVIDDKGNEDENYSEETNKIIKTLSFLGKWRSASFSKSDVKKIGVDDLFSLGIPAGEGKYAQVMMTPVKGRWVLLGSNPNNKAYIAVLAKEKRIPLFDDETNMQKDSESFVQWLPQDKYFDLPDDLDSIISEVGEKGFAKAAGFLFANVGALRGTGYLNIEKCKAELIRIRERENRSEIELTKGL